MFFVIDIIPDRYHLSLIGLFNGLIHNQKHEGLFVLLILTFSFQEAQRKDSGTLPRLPLFPPGIKQARSGGISG